MQNQQQRRDLPDGVSPSQRRQQSVFQGIEMTPNAVEWRLSILTDTSIGHEHVQTGFLGQDPICSFLDGSKAGVITMYPTHFGSRAAGLDIRNSLLSSSVFAAGNVDLGGIATSKHLRRRSTETIRACKENEHPLVTWEGRGASDLPPVMSNTLPVSSGTSLCRSKSSFTISCCGSLARDVESEAR